MISPDKTYYVYIHTNKINGKKYVGITSQPPEKRWGEGRRYDFNEHFTRAIKKYGWDGFEHEVLFQDLSPELACYFEKVLIENWKCNDPEHGYNQCEGGGGCSDINLKAVDQYTLDGVFVKRWNSMKEVDQALNGGKRSAITAVCNNHRGGVKSALGFQWKFADDPKPITPNYSGRNTAVNQYDMKGNLLKTWGRIKEAADALNIDAGAITKVCKPEYKYFKSAGGFVWKYAENGG